MYIKQYLKRTAAPRFVTAGAAVLLSAVLAACGGGDDAGIASTMGKSTMMAAKPGLWLPSTAIPIQPNQSVTNLSSNGGDGSGELWYSLTLPVGTSAVKIATSGGSGTAAITANTSPDQEVMTIKYPDCVGGPTCELAFTPLTQPTTYYINVGTRSSYSNKTLTTYVTPEIIPLDSGVPFNGLSGTQDTLTRFSIVVPPGSKNFSIKLAPDLRSEGEVTVKLTRGTPDLTYEFSCGPVCTDAGERNPIPATYYVMVYPVLRSGYSNWTLKATVE